MAINIIQGFNPSTDEPIDSRQLVANEAAKYAIASFNAYNGMIVYQQNTKALWVLTDIAAISGSGGWTQVGSGSAAAGYKQFDGLITTEIDKLDILNLYDPEGWNPTITSGSTGTYQIDFGSTVLTQNKTHIQISAGISPDAPGSDVIVTWAFDIAGEPRRYVNLYTFQDKALKDYLLLRASISVKVY